LLVVIALGYMLISPIINGLACVTFFLFFMLYKYLFLWQFDQPASGETGGLFFPKAIQHIFVGLYIQQVCLAALFFLAQNSHKKPSAVAEGALMVVLIIFTIAFHMIINNSYNPLRYALPLSLADKTHNSAEEELAEGNGKKPAIEHKDNGEGGSQDEIEEEIGEGEGDIETLDGPKDFNHPASVEAQRAIWIPQDELGLAQVELEDMQSKKIEALTANAKMNSEGKVEIIRV